MIGMSEILLILMIFVFIGWPWVRIVWKAGYSPWLGLLVFVPIANILFLYYLAFTKWPIERGLK